MVGFFWWAFSFFGGGPLQRFFIVSLSLHEKLNVDRWMEGWMDG